MSIHHLRRLTPPIGSRVRTPLVALGFAAAAAALLGAPPANASTTVLITHTDWCSQHYSSYDVRTDTYTGFDGVAHRCVPPFDSGQVHTFAQVSPPASTVAPNATFLGTKNPNGFGSGTSFRLYPCDEEGENNGTNNGC